MHPYKIQKFNKFNKRVGKFINILSNQLIAEVLSLQTLHLFGQSVILFYQPFHCPSKKIPKCANFGWYSWFPDIRQWSCTTLQCKYTKFLEREWLLLKVAEHKTRYLTYNLHDSSVLLNTYNSALKKATLVCCSMQTSAAPRCWFLWLFLLLEFICAKM